MTVFTGPLPDEEDRIAWLSYKLENGLLFRVYEQLDGSNIVTTYGFQEDSTVTPLVGDECIRRRTQDCGNDDQQVAYDLVTVTQEIIDCTDPIANLAPTDIALTNNTISEKEGIGTVIGTLSSFDPNVGDTHNHTIVADPDDKFEISGNNLRLKNLLDYDTATSHYVTIRSTDQGALFFDKQFQIFVSEVIGFTNDKATIFQGDSIPMDMSGPAANTILPSNGSFTLGVGVKKDNIVSSEIPKLVTGLQLWLDANDEDTITHVANSVSQWDDKSDNANHLTAPAPSNEPTLTPNGYGTRNSLTFDGTANYMTANIAPSKGEMTIFIVAKFNLSTQPAGNFDYLYSHGVQSANNMVSISRYASTDLYYCYDGGATLDGPLITGQVFTNFSQRFNPSGTYHELWYDGSSQTVTDNDTTFSLNGTFDLGRFLAATHYLDGEICEVIMYDNAISEQDRQTIETYLTNKWVNGLDYPESPDEISGLDVWLDADDEDTITEVAGDVSQWSDKSGNGNHAIQAVGVNQPTVMASGYGSRTTIAFDDPQFLQTTYATIQTTTIFAVFKHNHLGVQPSGPVWMLDSSAADTGFYPKWVDGDQYVGVTGTSWMTKATEFTNEQFYITAVVYDSSAPSSELFVDGVSNDTAASVEKAGVDFTIGRRLTDNANLKGEVAEILIYNKVLTDEERQKVESYLINKWEYGVDIQINKPLIDMGNMKLSYNQADKYIFDYLDGVTPMQLISQDPTYGDNTYHQIQIGYDSVAQSIHLHADGTTPTMESGVVLPARDSSTVRIAGDSYQTKFLDATVDEISMFDSHVDATELYNEGYAQDLLDNPSLPTPRLWLRMGDPADDYITSDGVLDRSGNGFHFTANNMSNSNIVNDGVLTKPIYANEKSLTLDGINQSANTGVTTDLSGSGDFSASIWYKGTAASYVLSQAHTLGPYSSDWIIGGGGAIFWMRSVTLGSLATINDNNWHNMILSWDSTAETYEGFLDGASIGTSGTISGYGGTGPVAIGTRGDFTTSFTAGLVDEPSLWNKKLVVADAVEIWNSGPPADLEDHSSYVNATNHWRCGEDTGDDVNGMVDQIGTSDATLNNYITDPYSTDVPT